MVATGGEGAVQATADDLTRASDVLTESGRALTRETGGVRRDLSIPHDAHDLRAAIVRFDEQREAFDRRAGAALEALGFELARQAIKVSDADDSLPRPVAAR